MSSLEAAREIKLHPEWMNCLASEFDADYMEHLRNFLLQQKSQGKNVFPAGADIFNALNSTPLGSVKLVILGQDPYHGPGQAHGLCFSVQPGVQVPPSLVNIYKELKEDIGFIVPGHGYLQSWAAQGVLLLNSVLTVEAHKAASHQGKGWERFTDKIVHILNEQKNNLVFVLWGAYAQKKGAFIDRTRHLVLQSPHPSPLSASRGFFGSKPFSQANTYLKEHGIEPIDWQLPANL